MPIFSIITAAHPTALPFFLETWKSIESSQGLGDWEWEWCIQEDGTEAAFREHIPNDPRISYAINGLQAGIAATRNVALSRAKGSWIVHLDCDDYFMPGGLAALKNAWTSHSDAIWAAGRADDFLEDEQRRIEFPNYFPDGIVTGDQMTKHCETHDFFPFVPGGAAARADVMRAIGGHFAAPYAEDVAMWMAIAQLGIGIYTSDVVFTYRQWSRQTVKSDTYSYWKSLQFTQQATRQRVDAIKSLGLYNVLNPSGDESKSN